MKQDVEENDESTLANEAERQVEGTVPVEKEKRSVYHPEEPTEVDTPPPLSLIPKVNTGRRLYQWVIEEGTGEGPWTLGCENSRSSLRPGPRSTSPRREEVNTDAETNRDGRGDVYGRTVRHVTGGVDPWVPGYTRRRGRP